MTEFPPCPKCASAHTYADREILTCPECGHEWTEAERLAEREVEAVTGAVRDASGNVLQDGDTVTVIKTLNVKGAQTVLKAGTKVRNIRLVDGDHNIDCKIDGIGQMGLKSEFVRKVT